MGFNSGFKGLMSNPSETVPASIIRHWNDRWHNGPLLNCTSWVRHAFCLPSPVCAWKLPREMELCGIIWQITFILQGLIALFVFHAKCGRNDAVIIEN